MQLQWKGTHPRRIEAISKIKENQKLGQDFKDSEEF